MTLRKRRVVFYSLLALFIILGSSIVLYSTGWRLNFKTLKLQKVGGIFVKSSPADAKIYLNGKQIKNTSGFLQGGTLVGNLFPTNYKLKLENDNFEAWQQNVSVSPSMVTDIEAVMIPKTLTAIATGTIQKFWPMKDGTVIIKDGNGYLALVDTASLPGSKTNKKIGSGDIIGSTDDSQYALIFNKNTGVYSWRDMTNGTSVNINLALKKAGLTAGPVVDILVDQKDKRRLVVLTQTKIYLFDTEKSSLTAIYKTDANAVLGREIAASQFYLAWTQFNAAHNTSTLIVYDKFLKKPLGSAQEFNGATMTLEWTGNKKLVVLQNNGGLYLYDPAGGSSKELADDVKNFALADDASAVAALENSSLEIIPLDQNQDYHRFNLSEREIIKNVNWYADNNHIFVSYPNHVSFLDLNDGGLSNFPVIAQTITSAYDSQSNRLYILKDSGLYGLDFPG